MNENIFEKKLFALWGVVFEFRFLDGPDYSRVFNRRYVERSFKLQGTIEKPTYCILALLRYSDYWKELDNEVNFRFVVDETPVKIISTLSYDQLKDLRYGYKLEKEMQYTGGGKAFNEWQEYLRVLGNLPDRFDNLEYKWLCIFVKTGFDAYLS